MVADRLARCGCRRRHKLTVKSEVCLSALLLALCAAGCAVTPTSNVNEFAHQSANNSFDGFAPAVGANALVLPVAHDHQTRRDSCGAHVLASVINYWRLPAAPTTGEAIYAAHPPTSPDGYTIAEVLTLARANGLLANGVRLPAEGLIRELESGRPVLVAIRVPSVFVQSITYPGANAPVIGRAGDFITSRVGRVSEVTGLEMVDHYVLVVGYDAERFVVVEPVMGYRTMSRETLARYRRPFENASIVFSASQTSVSTTPAEQLAPG